MATENTDCVNIPEKVQEICPGEDDLLSKFEEKSERMIESSVSLLSSLGKSLMGSASHFVSDANKFLIDVASLEECGPLEKTKEEEEEEGINNSVKEGRIIIESEADILSEPKGDIVIDSSLVTGDNNSDTWWDDVKKDFMELSEIMQKDTENIMENVKKQIPKTRDMWSNLWSYILPEEETEAEGGNGDTRSIKYRMEMLLQDTEALFVREMLPEEKLCYDRWLAKLGCSLKDYVEQKEHSEMIEQLLMEHLEVKRLYVETVTATMSHEDFFGRFFFHRDRLIQEDQQRKKVLGRLEDCQGEGQTVRADKTMVTAADDWDIEEEEGEWQGASKLVMREKKHSDMVEVHHEGSIIDTNSSINTNSPSNSKCGDH